MLLNVPLLREFGCMDESARFEYQHPLIYSSPFQLRMMLILKYKLMNSANHILGSLPISHTTLGIFTQNFRLFQYCVMYLFLICFRYGCA